MNKPMAEQHRRLPVWRTVEASYLALIKNFGLACRLAAIPVALIVFGLIATFFWGDVSVLNEEGDVSSDITIEGPYAIAETLAWICTVPTITAWHRLVILGHDNPKSRLRYSITSAEWSYVWKVALLIGLLLACIFFAIISVIGLIFLFFLTVGSSWLLGRVVLILPASAISRPMSVADAWRNTRGNTWRLFFTMFLTSLPVSILSGFINNIPVVLEVAYPEMSMDALETSALIGQAIDLPLWVIGLCVGTSVWSWSYRYLVEGEEITLPGERSA